MRGKCLCGAIHFELRGVLPKFSAACWSPHRAEIEMYSFINDDNQNG